MRSGGEEAAIREIWAEDGSENIKRMMRMIGSMSRDVLVLLAIIDELRFENERLSTRNEDLKAQIATLTEEAS